MDRAGLLGSLEDEHAAMSRLLDQITDERLHELAFGTWTAKDVVAHLAWWHAHSASVIDALRGGGDPEGEEGGIDEVNERAHREHLDDSAETVRAAFRESFTRLRDTLELLTEDDLFSAERWPALGGEPLVEMVLWDTSRHYAAHRDELARLASR